MSEPMKFNVQELRPEVMAFALLMEQRLRDKDEEKGQSWKETAISDLYVGAATKVLLIERALINSDGTEAMHAIDCANYAMMIADVSGQLECEK